MGEGVAIIDEDGVVAGHACPARDARNDRGAARDRRGGLDPSLEDRADDALVPELVAGAEPALGRELRHPRRGAGAAGAAVDGLLAVEHGVDRKSVVYGKSEQHGVGRIMKKKNLLYALASYNMNRLSANVTKA